MTDRGTYRGLGTARGSSLEDALKYHVTALRYGKHKQILQVKHVQFGWMPLKEYYKLQKLHDALPLIQTLIQSGYDLKAKVWESVVGVGTVQIPTAAVIITLVFADSYNLLVLQNGDLTKQMVPIQQEIARLQQTLADNNATIAQLRGEETSVNPNRHATEIANIEAANVTIQAGIAADQAQVAGLNAQIGQNQLQALLLQLAVVLPFGELYLFWRYATALTGGVLDALQKLGAALNAQPANLTPSQTAALAFVDPGAGVIQIADQIAGIH